MMGGEGKAKRQGLRSAVFKDVKDRIGKKVQAVKDAPKKAGEGIKKGIGAAVQAVKKVPGKIKDGYGFFTTCLRKKCYLSVYCDSEEI